MSYHIVVIAEYLLIVFVPIVHCRDRIIVRSAHCLFHTKLVTDGLKSVSVLSEQEPINCGGRSVIRCNFGFGLVAAVRFIDIRPVDRVNAELNQASGIPPNRCR